MRIMVRIMGLTIIGLCVSMMLMHSLELNIRYDELDKITSLAMSNTQLVMMENIEDIYYGTDNSRRHINDDFEYINLYKENMNLLISTNSDYVINDYIADARKGLLYVDVSCSFKTVKGDIKTFNKKLLNVVDVINKNEEDI